MNEASASRSILIVEDSEEIQALLDVLFSSEGYHVRLASNGKEALEILRSGEPLPSVILLDLSMPIMDGYRFREEQEKDPSLAYIPVVVMTAAGEAELRAMRIGARAALKKPFASIETIIQAIERVLVA